MKINNGSLLPPNLYNMSSREGETGRPMQLEAGKPVGANYDTVEISPDGRKLAEDAIVHRPETPESMPSKPAGAPDDYINIGDLMKRFDPEGHQLMHEAIVNGGDWYGVLLEFVHRIPDNKHWMDTYLKEEKAGITAAKAAPAFAPEPADHRILPDDSVVSELQALLKKNPAMMDDETGRNLFLFLRTLKTS
ncbi:hypothetical protein NDS46_05500 [Paenibacillus thiaminolyticus]|uniref:hypothetical protein n=1 Tax=Paenibacillus thiaminolyticus TaxID=49283 RepID=UPI00232C02FE|nr:hypothetical protein [Paenibacillus thiaminolyticus]WCF09353.1 hypothetical protein NDS46_05500 [Paenibacillus thiaminolyticus]